MILFKRVIGRGEVASSEEKSGGLGETNRFLVPNPSTLGLAIFVSQNAVERRKQTA